MSLRQPSGLCAPDHLSENIIEAMATRACRVWCFVETRRPQRSVLELAEEHQD